MGKVASAIVVMVAGVQVALASYTGAHVTVNENTIGWRGHAPGPIQCVSVYPRERTDGAPIITVNVDC